MLFELINALATSQNLINDALREYLNIFVITYLNDILVYSFETLSEHQKCVKKIFDYLKKRNLFLKFEKCDFHKQEVEFLEFIVRINDIRMNLDKLNFVKDWPTLTTMKEVQEFLEFVNYNRKFIKDYFRRAIPLSNLIVKDKPWKWSHEKQKAFKKLKEACLKNSVLKMINMEQPIRIEIDASNLVIRACLNQETKGK